VFVDYHLRRPGVKRVDGGKISTQVYRDAAWTPLHADGLLMSILYFAHSLIQTHVVKVKRQQYREDICRSP